MSNVICELDRIKISRAQDDAGLEAKSGEACRVFSYRILLSQKLYRSGFLPHVTRLLICIRSLLASGHVHLFSPQGFPLRPGSSLFDLRPSFIVARYGLACH